MKSLVLQVKLDPGEKLSGSMGILGTTTSLAFEGWIAFMTAMDHLRRDAGLLDPAAPGPDGGAGDLGAGGHRHGGVSATGSTSGAPT